MHVGRSLKEGNILRENSNYVIDHVRSLSIERAFQRQNGGGVKDYVLTITFE